MRKIYVKVEARLIIQADEGLDVSDMLDDMDYEFVSATSKARVIDTEIRNCEIEDSK